MKIIKNEEEDEEDEVVCTDSKLAAALQLEQ